MTSVTDFPSVGFDRSAAVERITAAGLGGVLLTSPENVFYATGYTALPSSGNPILYTLRNRLPFFAFVDAEGQVTLLCWGFSAEGVQFGIDRLIGINDFAGAVTELRSLLATQAGRGLPLAVESTCPRYVLDVLGEVDDAVLSPLPADAILDDLRLIKTPEEQALIRRSTAIIEAAVEELMGRVEIGMSRVDLMRMARTAMADRGAQGISHLTFSFGGDNPEIEIDARLERDALVTLDLGAIVGGYCSDNRRYVYTGRLPDALRARHETMVGIVDAVGALLVPGATHADIYRRALELHAEAGVEPLGRFTHTGHNIGLETEERWLADAEDEVIAAGMAINIELYSAAETGEQIGDEETYLVHADGPEQLTQLTRDIREIG